MDLALTRTGICCAAGFGSVADITALRDIPVVVVTASAIKGDRKSILARWFAGYRSKPLNAEMLKKTITEALHGND